MPACGCQVQGTPALAIQGELRPSCQKLFHAQRMPASSCPVKRSGAVVLSNILAGLHC